MASSKPRISSMRRKSVVPGTNESSDERIGSASASSTPPGARRSVGIPIRRAVLQVDPHRFGLGVVLHDFESVLASVARLLVAAERDERTPGPVGVNPDHPTLQ